MTCDGSCSFYISHKAGALWTAIAWYIGIPSMVTLRAPEQRLSSYEQHLEGTLCGHHRGAMLHLKGT
jgi:hypothetical protein